MGALLVGFFIWMFIGMIVNYKPSDYYDDDDDF